MQTIVDLIKSSVVTQGLITIILFIILGYMLIHQIPIPDNLYTFCGLVLGFYFGSKVGIIQGKNSAK